jgi:ABC-type phosphate transport system substrate-binding protein
MCPRPFVAVSFLVLALVQPARAEELAVIVSATRTDPLDAAAISQIYLKQRRFWDDGGRIVPINREAGSGLREVFVRHVLRMPARRLEVYWNRQYFQGVLPPATLASDAAVKRFVAGERKAIGYVDPRVVDDSVRVVLQIDAPPVHEARVSDER